MRARCERDAWVTRFYLTLALSYPTEKFWWLNRAFLPCLPIKKKSYAMTKKDNNNNCRREYGGTPLIRPPTGHGNLSVLTGVKAYHSLVLHTRALLLHRLTQSDQTEEKTSKLTNKRPPRTDWRPREQLHNYSQFGPFLIIKTYIYKKHNPISS